MPLWTDVIEPAELTDYARVAVAEYELAQGTLARFLPNRDIADVVARFVKGGTGLIDTARFRAYDAEPEVGRRDQVSRVTIELPALGLDIPVTEYEQLRLRSAEVSNESALVTIQDATEVVARAIADAIERLRGIVLATGRATIDQSNFKIDDDFGRPANHQVVAGSLWTTGSVSRLDYLQSLVDTYVDTTGQQPGTILMPTRVFRALSTGDEFETQLGNGASRRPSNSDVRSIVIDEGLPPIELYDRRVKVNGSMVRVLRDDTLLLLPPPVDPSDYQGTDLGATFWGRTLTSSAEGWDIAPIDQPGIVTGVWRNDRPPMGVSVIADAIGLPVLANADRSLAARVL